MRRLIVIGVGPGDPRLLTLRAREVLQKAPVVFFPVKAPGEEGVALEIVRGFIAPSAELVEVVFPMVKDQQVLKDAWKRGAETILNHPVPWGAFVTLGCPQVYSTYFYIHPHLNEIEVEIVPGVTSFSACSALMGEPLVLGNETMAVLSASHLEDVNWESLAGFTTVLFMKIPRDAGEVESIAERMNSLGFSKVFYLRRCGMDGEMISRGLPENPQGYLAQLVFKRD